MTRIRSTAFRRGALVGLAALVALGLAGAELATAQNPAPPARPVMTEAGFGIFQQRCLGCHGNPAYERAPSPAALREMAPERIYEALTNGVMKPVVGDSMSDTERRLVSESIAGRLIGSSASGDAAKMPNHCAADPPVRLSGPAWTRWGVDGANTRLQTAAAAGLSAAQTQKLKLAWAFGLPNSTSAYSQPAVAGGRVFVGADTGFVYAVDAKSGCVHWSFLAKAGVRAEPVIGAVAGRPAVFVGDLKANMYALDARTGDLIWTRKVDDHLTTRVTASPALYEGVLYVPVSSWEEFNARSLDYGCCTSVGSIVALDAATGQQRWKTYVIPERPQPTVKNSRGVQQYGPAGGSVWNTPAVDPKRHAIYFGTGDATTFPAAKTSDAVMALDMASGRVLWSYQVHANDTYLVGCVGAQRTENCPKVQGPDWDIPAAVILTAMPDGKRALLVGTKPGDVLALDPDRDGALIWRVNVHGPTLAGDGPLPQGQRMSGIQWGGAVEGGNVYYGLTGGGVVALRVADGARVWLNRLGTSEQVRINNGSPVTAIPGAVFVGGYDGKLRALRPSDGSVLWETSTAQPFETVNAVKAKGGAIASFGPTIAGGMLFLGSGYSVVGADPGNVLLAYAAQ